MILNKRAELGGSRTLTRIVVLEALLLSIVE